MTGWSCGWGKSTGLCRWWRTRRCAEEAQGGSGSSRQAGLSACAHFAGKPPDASQTASAELGGHQVADRQLWFASCSQPQVHQGGVPLLRLGFDPAASEVDPRYYQFLRGLWNITSPTAGEAEGIAWPLAGRLRLVPHPPCCCWHRSTAEVALQAMARVSPAPATASGTCHLQAAPPASQASLGRPSSCPAPTTATPTLHWPRACTACTAAPSCTSRTSTSVRRAVAHVLMCEPCSHGWSTRGLALSMHPQHRPSILVCLLS